MIRTLKAFGLGFLVLAGVLGAMALTIVVMQVVMNKSTELVKNLNVKFVTPDWVIAHPFLLIGCFFGILIMWMCYRIGDGILQGQRSTKGRSPKPKDDTSYHDGGCI